MYKKIFYILTMCAIYFIMLSVYVSADITVTDFDIKSLAGTDVENAYELPQKGEEIIFKFNVYNTNDEDKDICVIVAEYNNDALIQTVLKNIKAIGKKRYEVSMAVTAKQTGSRYKLFLWNDIEKTIVPVSEAKSYENLIDNSGMENENTQWQGIYPNVTTIERTEEYKKSGNSSQKVTINAFGGARMNVTDIIKNNGIGIYRISGWVSPTKNCGMKLRICKSVNDTNSVFVNPDYVTCLADNWTQLSVMLCVDEALLNEICSNGASLFLDSVNSGTTFYMDDFSCIKNSESVGTVEVYPAESAEFIKNPYKGWAVHGSANTVYSNYSDDVWDNASMIYVRMDWKNVNPENDVYNFDKIDKLLEFAENKNIKAAFGFQPINVNNANGSGNADNNWQSAPDFLFDELGCNYTTEGGIRCPDWNDEIYYNAYKKFIEAFAKKYDGDKRIYFIENRFYGNWGEWHLLNLKNSQAVTEENAKKFIDAFDCFTKTWVAQIGESTIMSDVVDYAINTKGYMTKKDGFLNPNHTDSVFVHGKKYSQKTPYAGEWYGVDWAYSNQKENGVWTDTLIEDAIREAGLTILNYTSRENETEDFVNDNLEAVKRLGNFFGYWFKPIKISYPENLGNGTKGSFTMNVKNDGFAPYFGNREKTGCMKLALLSSNNEVIETKLLSGVNICNWQPGEYSTVMSDFEFNYNSKAAKLAVGLFTDKDLTNPDIRLGISDTSVNNWYIVNDMNKIQSEKVSCGRIYKESSMAGDKNYGYYSGRYAFDDDETTFWRTASVPCEGNEQWLEIDFGEETSFSSFNVKENGNVFSWELQYLNDSEEWVALTSGEKLPNVRTSFTTVSSKKARLFIKESNGYVEISELEIFK